MVYIILGNGFEEIEATAPGDILRRGGIPVIYAGIGGTLVAGAHGMRILADVAIGDVTPEEGDCIVIPGGLGGVESIEGSPEASKLLISASKRGCILAAMCAGPRALASLGLLDGQTITCYPGMEVQMTGAGLCDISQSSVRDGGLITARAPGSALDFGFEILRAIGGDDAAAAVAEAMVYGR